MSSKYDDLVVSVMSYHLKTSDIAPSFVQPQDFLCVKKSCVYLAQMMLTIFFKQMLNIKKVPVVFIEIMQVAINFTVYDSDGIK